MQTGYFQISTANERLDLTDDRSGFRRIIDLPPYLLHLAIFTGNQSFHRRNIPGAGQPHHIVAVGIIVMSAALRLFIFCIVRRRLPIPPVSWICGIFIPLLDGCPHVRLGVIINHQTHSHQLSITDHGIRLGRITVITYLIQDIFHILQQSFIGSHLFQ